MTATQAIINSRYSPRDLVDLGLGFLLMLPVGGAFFVLPVVFVYFMSGDYSISVRVGFGFFLVLFLTLGLSSFASVTPDARGLTFRRHLGSPVYVPWDAVVSMDKVSRSSVFFRVWLWPGIPPRGSILCMSASHHYLIQWDTGRYYFSPKHVRDFEPFIDSWRKRREAGIDGAAIEAV